MGTHGVALKLKFRALECPLSRLICVIPLFGLDMGATWAKSIPSSHGVTLKTLFGLSMGGTWARFMSTVCYYVVWALYVCDLPFEPWECPFSRLICVIPLFGLDMGAIYVYYVLLRCLGSIWARLAIRALGMSPLTANMCYSVVWARHGRDLGQINPLKP